MELIVGCVTRMPEGYTDRYFNVEVYGEDLDGNRLDKEYNINLYYLIEDIQCMVEEIVDEVVYLLDGTTCDLLWTNEKEDPAKILVGFVNIKDSFNYDDFN